MPTRPEAIIRAKKLEAKLARIQTLKRSYAFRLAAIVASDNRKGKVWNQATLYKHRLRYFLACAYREAALQYHLAGNFAGLQNGISPLPPKKGATP